MSTRPEPTGTYLCDLLGVDFTDDQLRIATADLVPQLVVAGAGSGKTMVMAARVVHAVAYHGLSPGQVLGLTFTNKAAGELAERVRTSLGKVPAPADASADDGFDELPTVSTYHAYAAQIVRDHALRIGREPVTTLLTEATQWQLALRVVRSAPGPFEYLDWGTPHVARLVIALAGELAEHLVEADDVRDHDETVIRAIEAMGSDAKGDARAIVDKARARGQLLQLVECYVAEKERLDLIDYGDQVALAARIAQTAPLVGAIERRRFGLVVLDEYQDTGVAQRMLLSELFGAGHPVTAVGDPSQAIYGWRGASVGNLLRFGEHFPRADGVRVQPLPLRTSFRSGGRILDAANAIAGRLTVSPAAGRRPALDVPPLAAQEGAEDAGVVEVARLLTADDEADWLADRFAAELAAGTEPKELAVLVRRRADFARLHAALVARDVPVEVVGLGGLLEMPEVADVVAVLSLLSDATANAAAIRLLTGPRWRLGLRDLAALGKRAAALATWSPPEGAEEPPVGEGGVAEALRHATDATDPVDIASLLDAVESLGDPAAYSPEAVERLRAFAVEIRTLRRLVGQPLIELVTEVVGTTGLDVEIEAQPERVSAARTANLAAFLDHAAHFSGLEGESDLSAFLGYLDAAADADNGLDAGAVSTANTVKLLTVHKAKGLEWQVVAVPGLVKDVFPSRTGRSPWTKGAQVLPFPCRGDSVDLPSLTAYEPADIRAFAADCKADDADEERRLAYVAFTRAKRRLLASAYCWSPTRVGACEPSLFIGELRDVGAPVVEVVQWCDDPLDEANPLQARVVERPWPEPPDPALVATRKETARLVEHARSGAVPIPALLAMDEAALADRWEREGELLLAELRRTHAPVRLVPLPRRLSASQLVLLRNDPDELARALARPLPSKPRPEARRGTRFHAWVEERAGFRPLIDPEELAGSADEEIADDADLEVLREAYLASDYGDRVPHTVEAPFDLVLGSVVIRGRIDAVFQTAPDRYEVVDWKTGTEPADPLQLAVYRVAWAQLRGVPLDNVEAAFVYVRSGKVVRYSSDLPDEQQLAELLSGSAPQSA